MRERKFFKKIASFVLALAMILVAIPAVEAKAATNVTVHFKNTENWSKVYSYTWGTDGELFGAWPGSEATVDSANDGYYVATVEGYKDSVMNIIFNDGNGVQTVDLLIGTAQSSEWWIVPTANTDGKFECAVATSKADAEAGTSTPVEKPEAPKNEIVTDSIVIDGGKVTFYYESATANKVEIAGSFNGWTMVEMAKDGNVYSYTADVPAGNCEYKFIIDGTWSEDPLNPAPADNKDGNSVFEMTGEAGDSTDEPTDTPSTGEVTYTVYAYSATEGRVSVDAAALWVWDLAGGGEGKEVTFTGTEEIDGKTWVKAEVKVAPTAELGLIFKALGSWDWQTSDLSYADAEGKGGTLYIVDGDSVIYTSVEDIEFAPAQTPADTEDKADTDKKEENKDNDKKDEPTSGDDLTLVWVIVVVIIVAAAIVAVIVYKKLTAVPVAKDVDDDDDEDEAVEEKTEE